MDFTIEVEYIDYVNILCGGTDNPADCASRGIFPSELLEHSLWWNGPSWLSQDYLQLPQANPLASDMLDEEQELCLVANVSSTDKLIDSNHYSDYSRLRRVVAYG